MIAGSDNAAVYQATDNSRQVAAAAQQDSSTMKNIAILTMLYLPGSFVSSLFSIPLFNWNDVENSWRRRLVVYSAVTGPLTLVTFLFWALLVRVQRYQRQEAKERRGAAPVLNDHRHSYPKPGKSILKRREMVDVSEERSDVALY